MEKKRKSTRIQGRKESTAAMPSKIPFPRKPATHSTGIFSMPCPMRPKISPTMMSFQRLLRMHPGENTVPS